MNQQSYYNSLRKPFFAPPSAIFGIVWPILYVLIAISFAWSLWKVTHGTWSAWIALVIVLNSVSNALYSPLFFRWKKPLLATIDVFVVVATLVLYIVLVLPESAWVALLVAPYLLWTMFASVLQASIFVLNHH